MEAPAIVFTNSPIALCNDPANFSRWTIQFGRVEAKKGRDLSCFVCGKLYDQVKNLNRHIRSAHVQVQKRSCSDCGMIFHLKRQLSKHVRTVHLKEDDFCCRICPSSFALHSNLVAHVNNVHLKLGKFACGVCSKKFATNSLRNRHWEIVHGPSKDVACRICFKVFKTRYHLLSHGFYKHRGENVISVAGKTNKEGEDSTVTVECEDVPTAMEELNVKVERDDSLPAITVTERDGILPFEEGEDVTVNWDDVLAEMAELDIKVARNDALPEITVADLDGILPCEEGEDIIVKVEWDDVQTEMEDVLINELDIEGERDDAFPEITVTELDGILPDSWLLEEDELFKFDDVATEMEDVPVSELDVQGERDDAFPEITGTELDGCFPDSWLLEEDESAKLLFLDF